jgi:hypothetical protein
VLVPELVTGVVAVVKLLKVTSQQVFTLAKPWRYGIKIPFCRIRANRELEGGRYVEFRDLKAGKASHATRTESNLVDSIR